MATPSGPLLKPPSKEVLVIIGLGGEATVKRARNYVSFLNKLRHGHFIFFEPQWHSDETYTDKYARLEEFYGANGKPEVVFAYSAGVALATVLVSNHSEIEHAHLVCGKALRPENIQQHYLDDAPGFRDAVIASSSAISQGIPKPAERITCYVPAWRKSDGIVEKIDMLVPGCKQVSLPPLMHAQAIGYSMARYLPFL